MKLYFINKLSWTDEMNIDRVFGVNFIRPESGEKYIKCNREEYKKMKEQNKIIFKDEDYIHGFYVNTDEKLYEVIIIDNNPDLGFA